MKNILFICFTVLSTALIAQSYQNAESVEWDEANNRWLVANGSNIIIDDGLGNLDFFGTASASHGMEIVGDILFAIDSNVIKGYVLEDTTEVMSLTIPGVGFLNGMGSDKVNEILYISDFADNKIFSVDVSDVNNPVFEEIVSDTGDTPNGVLYDVAENNRLLFVTWGNNAKIKQVDLADFSVSDVVSNTEVGNIDGIVYDPFGFGYFISSWSPARISSYTNDFSSSDELMTSPINNPADLGIRPGAEIIGIPIGDDVVFEYYGFMTGVNEYSLNTLQFSLSENPVKNNAAVQFTLEETSKVDVSLVTIQGKLIKNLYASGNAVGQVNIDVDVTGVSSGIYLIQLTINNQILTKKILVD